MGRRLLIFGHGYSAGVLTARLVAAGWTVAGTTRGDGAAVAATGAVPLRWPGGDDAAVAAAIAGADAILQGIPPAGDAGDPVLARWGAAIASARPGWIGYWSTTAVYGDRGGDWVDEATPPAPTSPRGHARLAAERAWTALAAGCGAACHVFRLAGIYGPGRSALDRVRAGDARRIVKPGQVFSRIHVDDIAAATQAALDHPGGVWNLADDEPGPPQDVIAHAAALLGVPPPPDEPFDAAAMSPMAAAFYGDNKRVGNRALRQGLGMTLAHPDYRAGLAAILAAGG